MYIVPPGGMTSIHKDGMGSADSGHICARGINEVVMFPSLTPAQEQIVLERLQADANVSPHELPETHKWPTVEDISHFKEHGCVAEVHLC